MPPRAEEEVVEVVMPRSVGKGPFVDGYLLKKADAARASGRHDVIKTWSRRSTILPQFVDPDLPVASQMIWLALGSILPEFAILFGYGALAGRASPDATLERFARWTEPCRSA